MLTDDDFVIITAYCILVQNKTVFRLSNLIIHIVFCHLITLGHIHNPQAIALSVFIFVAALFQWIIDGGRRSDASVLVGFIIKFKSNFRLIQFVSAIHQHLDDLGSFVAV
eukprot:Blabericola_migrator_1__1841@NODE_14_length_24048_cov_80_277428_g11_i0_p15_GENE_NODE_14_length_24048_cov_80_277428_g11_i0NODE_14_length_24048_cov_80_277428_g11_i0_p15_ORF_typecomplete_len110_score14_37AzlC/PF03591_14/0_023UPF0060/PF02694_15/0_033_NODE_14_length_24048_cov_80_277428_g11_i01846018789